MRPPGGSDLFHAYMRGWYCGAGYRTIDKRFQQHPIRELHDAYFDGYADGRTASRIAAEGATKTYGYRPSILRTSQELEQEPALDSEQLALLLQHQHAVLKNEEK